MAKRGPRGSAGERPARPVRPTGDPDWPDLPGRYRLLAENSRDLIGLITGDGRWRYVSPASQTLLGFDPSQLEGKEAFAFVHPQDRALLADRMRNSLQGGPPPGPPPEFRMRRADGSWVWVEGNGSALRAQDGTAQMQVSIRDITARRSAMEAARDAARRLQSVYETITDAYVQVDRGFRVVYANPVATRLGKHWDKPSGLVLWDAFPDLRGTKYETEIRRALHDNVAVHVEEHYPILDRWFEASAYPSPEGLSLYFHDVTERKRAQETERLAYQRSLEIASLKEINQYKTEFVNTAAHELGNPMTPIRIQMRLLRAAAARGAVADMQRCTDTMERNVDRLVHLVEDILEGARLQASRLVVEPESMDFAALVHDAVETYREAATAAGIEVEVQATGPVMADADPKRMGQVLANMLSNAIKYGAKGGHVRVEVRKHEAEVHVMVADDGRGIDPGHLPHLFQPFSRLAIDSGPEGSGLGLYICAGIVKHHGGRIWCESDGPGQGSRFHFTIPSSVATAP